jgi:hypothetical protein
MPPRPFIGPSLAETAFEFTLPRLLRAVAQAFRK